MKKRVFVLLFIIFQIILAFGGDIEKHPIKPVPFTAVHINDSFWTQRLDTLREITIRYAFQRSEKAGYIDNFAIAGGLKEGKYQSVYPFDDAEVYKIIEGASYLLSVKKDPGLEAYIDSIITIIVSAQEPDGYLFTNKTISNPLHPWVGEKWEKDWDLSHETFNAGELYEAAIAYYYATGKRQLLDAAIKNADLICEVFNKDGLISSPGHAVIEMALVRLYEATGNEKYLDQARFFLECRGHRKFNELSNDLHENGKYWQDNMPAIQQTEAVGHAVRAMYFYSGMVDVAMFKKDEAYLTAIDAIWDNIISKKMYITGGLGSTSKGEAFGENYDLPNATAYCETCASIANCMFNLRMFRLHGESKYIDVLERSLYNTVLSGLSTRGNCFFYPNVLEVDNKGQQRSLWFECSCCPTNLCRLIPSVPGYVYATDQNAIYANLFIGNTSDIDFNGKKVTLVQTTNYPWEGQVDITIDPAETNDFDLKIRIPGWSENKPVPSDLYYYTDTRAGKVKISINGMPYSFDQEKGYAVVKHEWKKGDKVSISFPMEARKVLTNQAVKTNNGLVAVERGPLVYCAEFVDNNGEVFNLSMPKDATFQVKKSTNLLNGVYSIEATGKRYTKSSDKKIINEEDASITLIPYYARAYRGAGEMKVWLPLDGEKVKKSLRDELRLVDEVLIGDTISEGAHNLKGENSSFSRGWTEYKWRVAKDGWFSYELDVVPDKAMELVLTYNSNSGENSNFEILIDGQKIAVENLHTETFDRMIDQVYPIPAELTKGKKKVVIRIQALPGKNTAGPVFGCKTRIQENI